MKSRPLCPRFLRSLADRFGGLCLLTMLAVAGTVPGPADAKTVDTPLTIALSRLARSAHIELLFDERLVAGKSASAEGRGDPERRLRAILADTGLTFRRSATGAYLVIEMPSRKTSSASPQIHAAELPIADILVVGRRTMNADIRRDRDDIQPYQVFDFRTIERSQSRTLDAFLRTDFLQNREFRSLEQTPLVSESSVRSQVDVHGLGTEQTLVLIDGRRLPRTASAGTFVQPDVNAFPLNAVDRIETIGTTAGGIFGIGAAGGAVNVIAKGDFDDVSVAIRSGISDQGDAAQRSASLHYGITSSSGRTRVSVRLSAIWADGLEFGDRPYVEKARLSAIARDPSPTAIPVSNSINISGLGQKLVLLLGFGGTVLNGTTTFLPLDAPAIGSGGAAVLASNVGHIDMSLSPDGQGRLQTYVTPTKTQSALLSMRQDIGADVVVFGDYLRLETEGRATVPSVITSNMLLLPGQSGNPFTSAILVSFPTVGSLGEIRNRTLTDRLTFGGIVNLGHGWSASIDVAAGHASQRTVYDLAPTLAGSINVFSGPVALADQLSSIGVSRASSARATNRLHDLNLKIAGSPLTLPAGSLYLTMTGELREEKSPGEVDRDEATPFGAASTTLIGGQKERVASAFVELRAPLVSERNSVPLLRGLELQLALRHDRYSLTAPIQSAALLAARLYGSSVTARGGLTAATAGLRVRPVPGLTLRGSFATGYTPPTAAQITPKGFNNYAFNFSDPKRGGEPPFTLDRTFEVSGGSPRLEPQLARTLSMGAIVEPDFAPGLRISMDYSHLSISREIGDYAAFDSRYFIDHEDAYPGRVVRAPLTAADRAQGFTAGRITLVDSTYLTVGRSVLDVVDVALDYAHLTSLGDLQFHTKASWEPKLSHQGDPDLPAYNSVNSVTGPLSFRANAGIDWSKGRWSAGANAQTYGSYRVTYAYQTGSAFEPGYTSLNRTALLQQGRGRIPAQAYVDAYVGWAGPAGADRTPELTLRFGVKNVLGKRPPLVVPSVGQGINALGYSYYGDARGRQFVLDASVKY